MEHELPAPNPSQYKLPSGWLAEFSKSSACSELYPCVPFLSLSDVW